MYVLRYKKETELLGCWLQVGTRSQYYSNVREEWHACVYVCTWISVLLYTCACVSVHLETFGKKYLDKTRPSKDGVIPREQGRKQISLSWKFSPLRLGVLGLCHAFIWSWNWFFFHGAGSSKLKVNINSIQDAPLYQEEADKRFEIHRKKTCWFPVHKSISRHILAAIFISTRHYTFGALKLVSQCWNISGDCSGDRNHRGQKRWQGDARTGWREEEQAWSSGLLKWMWIVLY